MKYEITVNNQRYASSRDYCEARELAIFASRFGKVAQLVDRSEGFGTVVQEYLNGEAVNAEG